ncbi:MAG: OmpA family protein [Candidatus Kapabacteria bacterium]|nr:OmpA family protein [Candidatus Kapabacteria bacterium]
MKIFIFLLIFTLGNFLCYITNAQTKSTKQRLPEIINSYQPAIVPVTNLKEETIYFDRKIHPENINGINDNDDIWYSKKNENNAWTEPKNIGINLNTKDSDVLFSLTPDGQFALVYGIYQPDGSKTSGFSISRKINGVFSSPEPIKIQNFYNNSKNFYGCLSSDKRVLLMSLNRDDSFGDLDLYVSFFDEKSNTFSEPKNLGPIINTKGSEASVHLALDGKTLYFSSNGHKGNGKLDIFMTRRLDNSWIVWSEPINLGESINSQSDDGNLWLTALGNAAYLVSYDTITKREGIYLAEIPDSLRPLPYALVSGKVFKSSKNDNLLVNESIPIALIYEDSQNVDTVWSDAQTGTYSFAVRKGILASAIIDYKDFSASFSIATYNLDFPKWFEYDIILRKYESESTEKKENQSSENFSTTNNLNESLITIYFELDSDKLTSDSKQILSDFFKKSTKYKKLKIVGHTDESGSDEYNYRLSKKRADNTLNYIKKNKLTKAKLIIEAKGKTSPKSENHELNRRVEIYQIN